MSNDKVVEAVEEASISVACLLDDVAVNEDDILNGELDLNVLQKDIEHLQDQITIIENNIEKYCFNFSEKEIKLIIDWLEDYYQTELYADTKKLPDVVNKLKEKSDE